MLILVTKTSSIFIWLMSSLASSRSFEHFQNKWQDEWQEAGYYLRKLYRYKDWNLPFGETVSKTRVRNNPTNDITKKKPKLPTPSSDYSRVVRFRLLKLVTKQRLLKTEFQAPFVFAYLAFFRLNSPSFSY